ncbi:MAG: TonB-dependent receptor [Bacteroidota bacterium]|nr:TonB-dependent receptor [Bacteroidota bacterium]
MVHKYLLIIALVIFSSLNTLAQKGQIAGRVVDAKSGEPLSGVNINLKGKKLNTFSDNTGGFQFTDLDSGVYNLEFINGTYKNKAVNEVSVQPNNTTTIKVKMENADAEQLKGTRVTATRAKNTEAAIVLDMKRSDNIVSGISASQIQKGQDRDASEVVRRVPGVTIIENRFIMIRGLNDRYNTVWLNDAAAPSSETDKKAFSFDIIPAGLIDKILIYKTPSADLPGDFAGGMVKIYTKAFPEKTSISFDIKSSYRSGSTGNMFDYNTKSKTDWLGFDDGQRKLPTGLNEYISKYDKNIESETKAFSSDWAKQEQKAMPDMRVNFNFNKLATIRKVKLGNIFGISYSNTSTVFNVQRQDWDSVSKTLDLSDKQSTQTVRLNILENFAIKFGNHRIEFKNLLNQTGMQQTVLRNSDWMEGPNEKSYQYSYQSKTTYTSQLSGNHKWIDEKLSYDWTAGYSRIHRIDPDLRRIRYVKDRTAPDSMYKASVANVVDFVNGGGRFFSTLNENVYSIAQSLKYKTQIKGMAVEASTGGYVELKERSFEARVLGYVIKPSAEAQVLTRLPIEQIFAPQNIGTPTGFKLDEITSPSDKYRAQNKLFAGYGMLNVQVSKKIKVVGGLRYEYNKQALQSRLNQDSISPEIITKFWLPSFNVAYNFNKQSLLRMAYGKTLNRPEFREWSPFFFYDFNFSAGTYGSLFNTVLFPNGNILKVASIQNFDLRYELYGKGSDFVQVGAFYKFFKNPIQQIILSSGSDSRSFSFVNGDWAYTQGVEIDFRKNMGALGKSIKCKGLSNLNVVGNISVIQSRLYISKTINQTNKTQLQGQSPYIINAGFYYQNDSNGLQISLLYNVFGPRIFLLGTLQYPNIGELSRHTIDITISQKLNKRLSLNLGIQDMLNNPVFYVQDTDLNGKFSRDGSDKLIMKFRRGAYYTLGVKVTL